MKLFFVIFILSSSFNFTYGNHCNNTRSYENLLNSKEVKECVISDCSIKSLEYKNIRTVKFSCENITSTTLQALPGTVEIVILEKPYVNDIDIELFGKFKYFILNEQKINLKNVNISEKGTIIKIMKGKRELFITHNSTFADILNINVNTYDNIGFSISLCTNVFQALFIVSILIYYIFLKKQPQDKRSTTHIMEVHYKTPRDEHKHVYVDSDCGNHVYAEPINSLRISKSN